VALPDRSYVLYSPTKSLEELALFVQQLRRKILHFDFLPFDWEGLHGLCGVETVPGNHLGQLFGDLRTLLQ
jgi:hypothetical protein